MIPPFLASSTQASFLISLCLFIGACSLYKSNDRKNFESAAEQNLSLQQYKPIQCDEITQVTYWYETQVSAPHSQWIESLPHLEVWQDNLENQKIRIRTYEKHTDQPQQLGRITRCQSTFSTLLEWKEARHFYLKSLEGDQL